MSQKKLGGKGRTACDSSPARPGPGCGSVSVCDFRPSVNILPIPSRFPVPCAFVPVKSPAQFASYRAKQK